jgi:hypothetical protein
VLYCDRCTGGVKTFVRDLRVSQRCWRGICCCGTFRPVDWCIGIELLAAIFRIIQENTSMAPDSRRLERRKTEVYNILYNSYRAFLVLTHISLTNQCILTILYYTIQFTVKLVRHVSNPYFGIIIRDLDCELCTVDPENNWDILHFNFCTFKMYQYCWFVICVIHNPSPSWWSHNRDSKHVGLVLW